MSFRTEPLPSYEDILSGAFLKLKSEKEKENKLKPESQQAHQFKEVKEVKNETSAFKYKNVVPEDGEIPEEGEISENVSKTKKRSSPSDKVNNNNNRYTSNNNNTHSNSNNLNKIKNNKQKQAKLSPNFAANISTDDAKKPNSASSKPSPFVPRLICRYFMEGICSKGDKCTFSHSVVPNKTVEEARVKEPCKFFIMGSCMKGEACYFSHDLSVVPCKFFHLRGECSAVARGLSCRFSHSPIDRETLEKLRTAEIERIKEQKQLELSSGVTESADVLQQSSAPKETPQTCNEAEKATECPHDYLNPFAFAGSEDEACEIEDGEC